MCRSRPHTKRNLLNFREIQNFRPRPHPQEAIWVVRATSRGIYILTTAPLGYIHKLVFTPPEVANTGPGF